MNTLAFALQLGAMLAADRAVAPVTPRLPEPSAARRDTAGVLRPAAVPLTQSASRWLGADKVRHFALAGFVQSVSFAGARAAGLARRDGLAGATLVSAAVSLGKEWHDRRAGRPFDTRDLVWDALGIAVASLPLARTTR